MSDEPAARTGRMRDLPARIGTAIVFVAVILGVLFFGRELGWAILVSTIAVLCLREFYSLTRETRLLPNEILGLAAAAAMPLAALFFGKLGLLTVVTIFVVAALGWYVAFRQVPLADTAVTVLGVMYVAFGLTHLVLIRGLDAGALLVLTVLLSVWAADVGAYFVGSLIGRHKLAPSISPGKSWEGFAGGILGSVLVWSAAYQIADTGLGFAWHIGIGVAAAVAGLFGDLLESRIKREVGVKDSSNVLPGHGGFLDRFDSLIVVAVVAYYLLAWSGAS